MDIETLKYISQFGVGGVAILLLWFGFQVYRKDSEQWRMDGLKREDTMTQIVKENTAAVANNTSAVAHLTDFIKNGKHT